MLPYSFLELCTMCGPKAPNFKKIKVSNTCQIDSYVQLFLFYLNLVKIYLIFVCLRGNRGNTYTLSFRLKLVCSYDFRLSSGIPRNFYTLLKRLLLDPEQHMKHKYRPYRPSLCISCIFMLKTSVEKTVIPEMLTCNNYLFNRANEVPLL
jgi:hypothetical protein